MKKVQAVLALSVVGVIGLMGRRFRSTRGVGAPLYPDFSPRDFPPELFEVTTEDGITLRGKRYANPGAVPVILMHGLTGNGFSYDLAYERYNFALYLARRGYDVWVANFRGCGRGPYRSDGGDFSHSVESLGAYDVKAIIRAVREETGNSPVWVGHSMGAVTMYGYLQGLDFAEEGGRRRLVREDRLAEERNREIAAFVSIAGPTCFRWPRDSVFHWLFENPAARSVLAGAAGSLHRLGRYLPRIPVESQMVGQISLFPRAGPAVAGAALRFFINPRNMTEETFRETLLYGSSDVSMEQVRELVKALVTGDLIVDEESGRGGYNVTEGMEYITVPTLFVTGDLDIVNHKTVYRTGYRRVSSEVKDYRCFPDFGHIDLLVGLDAPETVYPYVADWLERVVGEVTQTGVRHRPAQSDV